MLPKAYFSDALTRGVAFGTLQHVMKNRFTLLKLNVGYGKTVISMLVAKALATLQGRKLQLMVIAPKAKRLDKSFNEAIESTEKYFNVQLNVVPINGQEIGTFAGLNVMKTKKPEMWNAFCERLNQNNTLLILDETHMQVRNSTGLANKTLRNLIKDVEKHHYHLKILGLTATPFDTSVLDTIGYLILNGDYSSRTDFYKREINGYVNAYQRGLHQKDIENMIVDDQYRIHPDQFIDFKRVIKKLRKIIYEPDVPRNFHIPKNKFQKVPVILSKKGQEELKRVELLESIGAYSDNGTKQTDYIKTISADDAVMEAVIKIINQPNVKQPLIFYNADITKDTLVQHLEDANIDYLQVNGHAHTFFQDNDHESPVLVQYISGAAAFESKDSNTSIYIELPSSVINYQQSLGRNARRGQKTEYIINYIIKPMKDTETSIKWFDKAYNRIVNKNNANFKFEQLFVTPWGKFNENEV